MKTTIEKLLILFVLTIIAMPMKAQTTIEGEFRPRFEAKQGFKKPLADTLNPAFATLQRSRLSVSYKSGILNSQFTLQDSRVWGQSDAKSSGSKMEIYEAWAELLLAPGLSATVGRQGLKYDDQRLFSTSNWSNTGNAHDLLLLKYKTSVLQSHVGLAYGNVKDTLLDIDYTVKQYRKMGFVWLAYNWGNDINTSLIGICESLQKTTGRANDHWRNTLGANVVLAGDSAALGFNVGAYYQFGKSNAYDTAKLVKNSTYAKLNAYLLTAKINYKFVEPLVVFAGTDLYSGTTIAENNNKSQTFNKLYGANHSFNGYMEYWASLPKGGLKDFYFGINFKPIKKLSVEAKYHLFSLMCDMQYTNSKKEKQTLGRNLGSEADLTISYKLSKEATIQAGYSMYFTTVNSEKVLKVYGVKNSTPQWAYLMLTIRPQFYKTPEVKLN